MKSDHDGDEGKRKMGKKSPMPKAGNVSSKSTAGAGQKPGMGDPLSMNGPFSGGNGKQQGGMPKP